jgi:WD40 repeat protein
VRVWDVETGKELQKIDLEGRSSPAKNVALLKNGHSVLTLGMTEGTHVLILWDADTGKEIRPLAQKAPTMVFQMAVAPDERHVLLALVGSSMILWDLQTDKQVRVCETKFQISSLAFSPGGRYALSGHSAVNFKREPLDCNIRLWDVGAGKVLKIYEGHQYSVNMIAFSPDARQAVSASVSPDESFRLWDLGIRDERVGAP